VDAAGSGWVIVRWARVVAPTLAGRRSWCWTGGKKAWRGTPTRGRSVDGHHRGADAFRLLPRMGALLRLPCGIDTPGCADGLSMRPYGRKNPSEL